MNDWQTRTLIALIPSGIAVSGWLIALESRVQLIDTRQQERAPRIGKLEEEVERLQLAIGPTPQAKIILEEHNRRIDRLEARMNSLHEYILQLPDRPPFRQPGTRRGDLLEMLPQKQP